MRAVSEQQVDCAGAEVRGFLGYMGMRKRVP
jgi:hypothetical protein